MPSCFLTLRVGAHQAEDQVGVLRQRRPGLLAVDDVVVAVALGRGLERGEVGARARLGEALAPPIVDIARCAADNRFFCASLPKAMMTGPTMLTPKASGCGAGACCISSWKM